MIDTEINKEKAIITIVEAIKNSPSQKADINVLTNELGYNESEVEALLNDLVTKGSIKVTTSRRKKYYSISSFGEEVNDNQVETKESSRPKWKDALDQIREFVLSELNNGEVKYNALLDKILKKFRFTPEEIKDTSTDSDYTKYKGGLGTIIAELKKEGKVEVKGKGNNKSVKLKEKVSNKATSTSQNSAKTVANPQKEKTTAENKPEKEKAESSENSNGFDLKKNIDDYDIKISNTLDLHNEKINELRNELRNEQIQKSKEDIHEFLCRLRFNSHDSTPFEKLAGHVVCKLLDISDECFFHRGGSSDGGIDGEIIVSSPFISKPLLRVAIQAKCNATKSNNCSTKDVRTFIGDMSDYDCGFFVTSGAFDRKDCKTLAEEKGAVVASLKSKLEKGSKTKLVLIDGKMLVELMVEYRVGVLISKDGLIVGLDREFFENL